uniref:Uncharacterized protein n=1 Tax=Anguilla anguilla TaxID=7936 RepID=A0A0E9T3S4_ANGAN
MFLLNPLIYRITIILCLWSSQSLNKHIQQYLQAYL